MGAGAASSLNEHQEPPVIGDTVPVPGEGLERTAHVRDEERDGRTGFHNLPPRCKPEWNRHEPVIQRDVEQGLAVVLPAHLSAALVGNRHFASGLAVGR